MGRLSRVCASSFGGLLAIGLVGFLEGCSCGHDYPELRLQPVPGREGSGRQGAVRFSVGFRGRVDVRVGLRGLEADAVYTLTLNPVAPDSATSQQLGTLALAGQPLGQFCENPAGYREGYWDFAQVRTDGEGNYEGKHALPLPVMDYRIRFLVKERSVEGIRSILQSVAVLLAVDDSWP